MLGSSPQPSRCAQGLYIFQDSAAHHAKSNKGTLPLPRLPQARSRGRLREPPATWRNEANAKMVDLSALFITSTPPFQGICRWAGQSSIQPSRPNHTIPSQQYLDIRPPHLNTSIPHTPHNRFLLISTLHPGHSYASMVTHTPVSKAAGRRMATGARLIRTTVVLTAPCRTLDLSPFGTSPQAPGRRSFHVLLFGLELVGS